VEGGKAVNYEELSAVVGESPSHCTLMTVKKTLAIMERDQSRITGFVLTGRNGETTIVNHSAVRWLSGREMWELMHGKEAKQ
jgi:hypothetical protein